MDFAPYFHAFGLGFAAVFGARLGWECYDDLVRRLNRWAWTLDLEHGGRPIKAKPVDTPPPPSGED